MIDVDKFLLKYYNYEVPSNDMWTLEDFCMWKETYNVEEWDYPLEEYEHISQIKNESDNNIIHIPVRFSDGNDGYDYRFCEVVLD